MRSIKAIEQVVDFWLRPAVGDFLPIPERRVSGGQASREEYRRVLTLLYAGAGSMLVHIS